MAEGRNSIGLTRRALLGAAVLPLVASVPSWAQGIGTLDGADHDLVPGDGDQSTAFARALESAAGRPIMLAPGRYELGGLALPAHAHIVGVPGGTVLSFRGGPFLLGAQGTRVLRLSGLTLDGDAMPLDPFSGLLVADGVADLAIDDCEIVASGNAGLFLRNSAGRICGSRVTDCGTIGIHLRQSAGMRVDGNAVARCGDTGILVARDEKGDDGTIVIGNRVTDIRAESGGTGQNGNGINLDKANGVIVANNRVDGCAFSAVRCYSSNFAQVTGNVMTRSAEMALYVEFAFEGAVVANNLIDGGAGGISFANFMQEGGRLGTCSGNVVRNITGGPRYADGNPQIGAGISVEADMAVTGNTIEACVWGLKLGWGPYLRDVTATGNVIRDTDIGIAVSVVEDGGPAVIADNVITGARKGAILGTRWEDIATADLVDGAPYYPQFTVSGNRAG